MGDSDRSRSPAPLRHHPDVRNRDPPRQLPGFPRWCGPMGAAVRHFQNMPRPQMCRPQMNPQWMMQPRPFMGGESLQNSLELKCLLNLSLPV